MTGRDLRVENIQGFKDADGRLLKAGDRIETVKGIDKGEIDTIVGFRGLKVYLDDGSTIAKSYCFMVRVVS